MWGCGGPSGPLHCWHCLPAVAGGLVDWPPLPAVAESSSPAPGSGPGSGPILSGLLGYPGPGPGPASPGRCRCWAPGLAAGPGLPALPPDLAPLLPAWRSLHRPTHVPTRSKGWGMGEEGVRPVLPHMLPNDSSGLLPEGLPITSRSSQNSSPRSPSIPA